MSRIITNGSGPMHRGSDFCTLDQMTSMVMNTYGPVAKLITEMCDRMTAIEDKLGIVRIEPKLDEMRQADGGDIEC